MAHIRIDSKRHNVQHEGEEQALLFDWAFLQRNKYPELELMYHIGNGGQRNAAEAANLKRQGVKAGVPVYQCSHCNSFISRSNDFCSKCGQKIDWSGNNEID